MGNGQTFDVAIVGAGAAGLAAARTLQSLGRSFVVCEAMNRIGGRAFTDHATFGVPFDWGCHWLHSGSINIMREIADETGIRFLPRSVPRRIWEGGRFASETEAALLETSFERIYTNMIAAGRDGLDIPASETMPPGEIGADLFRTSLHAEWGFGPELVSTLDASRYLDTDENWAVIDGYGELVARTAAGIPASLNTAVEQIDWSGDPIAITTSSGSISARTAIITVSTNVIASELIAFHPGHPIEKLQAAADVPLGYANKAAFAIDSKHLGVDEHTNISVPCPGAPMIYFQLRSFGNDLAGAYLAGPLCQELESSGPDAICEVARTTLVAALGSKIDRHITKQASSTWGREPSILGSYAAARPGKADQRCRLGEAVGERLFFAGEATHPQFFSTCHGAHLTGISAAEQAATALD